MSSDHGLSDFLYDDNKILFPRFFYSSSLLAKLICLMSCDKVDHSSQLSVTYVTHYCVHSYSVQAKRELSNRKPDNL